MSKLKTKLSRAAVAMDIGGFRPPEDPAASWFGRVNLALPGETWPSTNGSPMFALCQINLEELPLKPARLQDLSMITIFIGPSELPIDQPNGQGWCLRAYKDAGSLEPLEQVKTGSPIKALPMRAREIKEDFPCLDDATALGIEIDDEDEFVDRYKNNDGFKLSGWPTLIQSEVSWGTELEQLINPEFVFQIDSSEKGHWQWGQGGVGYFGRGTVAGHDDDWALSWQCF